MRKSRQLRSMQSLALACALTGGIFSAARADLELVETSSTIVVRQNNQPVLTYNKVSPAVPEGIDPIYQRSGCLHPVASPAGRVATAMFPVDHAHQNGIFSAWVKTTYDDRKMDFWNLAKGVARVEHHRVVQTSRKKNRARFTVELTHKIVAAPQVDVLRERWDITVHESDGPWTCFDLETVQTALTDKPLTIQKYHYGGIAVRGPGAWILPKGAKSASATPACSFLNDQGSNRLAGNHQPSRWVAMTGQHDGQPVTIAVLCHPENFRAPQPARLHPTKPYFCFAPCVQSEFVIDRDHPYRGRYRYLITDAEPDPDWLNAQWSAWRGASKTN